MHVAECLAPFHGIAANLAGRCRLAAFCAQTRDAVGVKHAAVGGGKRFVGGRRIFCLHGAVGGVFAALGVIPRYLFKRQAALPQSALVGVEAVPKCFIVVDRKGVDAIFIPRDEDGGLVAHAGFGAEPFGVEIVANAVGGAFNNEQGVAGKGYRTGYRADDVVGVVAGGGAPECHFRQMGHGDVLAARCLGGLCRRDGDGVVAVAEAHRGAAAFKRRETEAFFAGG